MKKFNCLCCGDCCSGNMEIKLGLYDLYKIGKHMGFTSTKELFDKRVVELVVGQNAIKVPRIIFKTVPYTFCPFLINDINEEMELKGFCSLHPFKKPLVCILAPISKEYSTENGCETFSFTKPTENCPGELGCKDFEVEELLEPIKNELVYEARYFNILDSILTTGCLDYENKLYNFSIEVDFELTLENLSKLYIAK